VQKTADDLGLQKGDPSDFQKLVTNLFPGKAHRVAGYVFDEALGGLKTDLSSKPIIHFGQAFLKLPVNDQEKALAVEFDKIDQWCVDHGQLEAADLSDSDITDRIRGLSGAKLAQLSGTVQDPAVKTYVESLRTMTTPLEFGLTRQGTGDATVLIGNVRVIVKPDVTGAGGVGRGKAQTLPQRVNPDLRPFIHDNGTTVTRVDPFPPVTITIQTQYGPGANPDAPSEYGRGTTTRDIAIGAKSLRFHEGSHGRDILQFLHEHPFPPLEIRVGMNLQDVETAVQRWQTDTADYIQQLRRFTEQQTHCVGITIDVFNRQQGTASSVCGGGP
jgi:hypothetical protein